MPTQHPRNPERDTSRLPAINTRPIAAPRHHASKRAEDNHATPDFSVVPFGRCGPLDPDRQSAIQPERRGF